MCGIVGAVAQRDVAEILINGLHRLEYRGYDSAGVAVVDPNHELHRVRCLGKVKALDEAAAVKPLIGGTGIAHTRWATHGEPSEANAHPHTSGNFAVVHNGIIENHEELRELLKSRGYVFNSQTDTEVIAHLVNWEMRTASNLLEAVQKTVKQLTGAYGMVVLDREHPEHLVAARTVDIYDANGQKVEREVHESNLENDAAEKGKFRHFMQKEIYEQPNALINTMEGRILHNNVIVDAIGNGAAEILEKVEHIQIVACGTSYNAGMTARYWFEALAGVSCDVEIASEFRYRKFVTRPNSLLVTISQSGETADTLAALRLAKEKGYMAALTICNVSSSSLVRESDLAFMTRAGVEVGVASTKAFTTQLAALLMLVTAIGKVKGNISNEQEVEIVKALQSLPAEVEKALAFDKDIEALAEDFAEKNHALFLGRGEFYPIAMEASLKLKEISYIHAEAYAAGELKHGPLALIDADMPVIVVAPNNELLEKVKSNIEEVRARGGQLYVFADKEAGFTPSEGMKIITMPKVNEIIAPIFYTVPMQLLSYHVALIKGTDVDQPRNLAKSVTVE